MVLTKKNSAIDGVSRSHPSEQVNNSIFFRLFQLGNVLQRQATKEIGITAVQWAVLGALSRSRPGAGLLFGELAEYLVVSRQNLDGVLKRLERDNLVERIAGSDDKRARVVQLTPQGHKVWVDLQDRIYEFYGQAVSHLNFDERVSLLHYLNVLQKDLISVNLNGPHGHDEGQG